MPIRVVLLDDHEIVRRGIAQLLETEDDDALSPQEQRILNLIADGGYRAWLARPERGRRPGPAAAAAPSPPRPHRSQPMP